ncbi:NAD(P)H-dependent oxidoreductase [Ferruginivarius sediminum]|uniref:Flagellar biosynthesis protein FlgA n=1 Tax=Ferruginivarius sediminum TaxID=2661937 RepID=A0A369T737_9PROT|nr:Gfo/Idh/MocA family oxidoreductase [Ferruginivarius sediminum]RDD61149.1 flagellar biosynthesis protein FlgA [Ferruginivarius sediminum]
MNLYRMLSRRAENGSPIRVGLIGAGKFGTMFLAQARRTPGLHLMGIADLNPARAESAMAETGWPAAQHGADSFEDARLDGTTRITADPMDLIAADGLDVVIDATGHPAAGIAHARACVRHGRHLVMVNVEADVLAGPLLAREFEKAGLVYTMAYGDQPALIAELVDWARASGFPVMAAGKGTKYLEHFHASTPDTVWEHYGITPQRAKAAGMNPKMFNSFLDGTKSGIEMAAVANATGLAVPPEGLAFPPCGVDDLPQVLRPAELGGRLHHAGQVEVVSSLERDGRPVGRDLRWGVYVVIEAETDYVARCFHDYGLQTDVSGNYTALYRPYHMIGLELGISVANAALRGESTGVSSAFNGDVVAVAKRDLNPGEELDGEGGFCVWGRLMPAADSLEQAALPIGLAQGMQLAAPVRKGEVVTQRHVSLDESDPTVRTRREMEKAFAATRTAAE